MASAPNDVVLYQYTYSPYAMRVQDYLALRGIAYAQCLQPPQVPRPDLSELLNIHYRRIPLLAIGNHVYADSRLIIRKLEEKFPNSNLSASTADQRGIERLLSRFTTDGGVFQNGTALIPPEVIDDNFVADREKLLPGRKFNKEALLRGRPEALVQIRDCFEELEHGLLADGRDWILKTSGPSLGDIEAIWPFTWLFGMKGALEPMHLFSKDKYPRVHAWVGRYTAAVKAGKQKMGKPVTIKGPQAAELVLSKSIDDLGRGVDQDDPLGLKEGLRVQVTPLDYGASHRDIGQLVRLDKSEAAIEIETKSKGGKIYLHFPRWGFRIKPAEDQSKI